MRGGFLVSLFVFVIGCSTGGGSPVVPEMPDENPGALTVHERPGIPSNRYLWGTWDIHIPADRSSVDITPLRTADLHLNPVRMLETWPCADCLTFSNLVVQPPNVVSIDLTLEYPYTMKKPKLTSFDVRGIFISDGDYDFPATGRNIALGDGVPRLLNADGYTHLFNPTEFPVDQPGPPALRYIPGKFAPFVDLSGTLNPYLAFAKDEPRRMFDVESVQTRTARVYLPDGPVKFGYAIDCSWMPIDGPVTDPLVDFPLSANCPEAYQLSVWAGPGLSLDPGAWTWIYATVYDHQGVDTIASVTAEVPEVFFGEVDLSFHQELEEGGFLYKGSVTNENGAGTGEYPLLIRVVDIDTDENLGQVDAWFTGTLPVKKGWAMTWGRESHDIGQNVAVDVEGNIYVLCTGGFLTDLDPTPAEDIWDLSEPNTSITKFDWGGGYRWGFQLPVLSWYCDSLALDNEGNIFVASRFRTIADFDPGPGVDEHIPKGHEDACVIKFNSDGEYQWGRTWGGYRAYSIGSAVDSAGNIIIVGWFDEFIDFDPGSVDDDLISNGNYDIFLCKFSSNGEYRWGKSWGGTKTDYGGGVAIDSSGNIYVAGTIPDEPVDLDPGPGVYELEGPGTFLTRFSPEGEFVWAVLWIATSTDIHYMPTVLIDGSDDVFVVGDFSLLVDFDPGPGIDVHISSGSRDIYLSRFSPDGEYQWAKTWGGADRDRPCDGYVDGSGYLYVTGFYEDTVDFDPGDGIDEHTALGHSDCFASKLTNDGEFVWARTWGAYPRSVYGMGISVDHTGNCYITGRFQTAVDFDPGPLSFFKSPNGTSEFYNDAFLSKISPDGWWW